MGVTNEIVRFVCATSFEDLPEEIIFRTKTLIVDAVGTMLAGSCEEGSRILQRYIQQTGGREEATLIGAGLKGCAAGAALANAAAGHALDFDSIQLSSWPGTAHGFRIHPTVPALAAALAVGEPRAITGQTLLLACAVGIEVACRVTRRSLPTPIRSLINRPPPWGARRRRGRGKRPGSESITANARHGIGCDHGGRP